MQPASLDLDRAKALTVVWDDGVTSVYPLGFLRAQCPCAACKTERATRKNKPFGLRVITSAGGPLRVESAELVGNYALRISWSDKHASGIYSFEYLREIAGEAM